MLTSVHTSLWQNSLAHFVAGISLNIYHMWRTGQISGVAPQTRRERLRLLWVVIGAGNSCFIAHVIRTALALVWQREIGGRALSGLSLMARTFRLRPGATGCSYCTVLSLLLSISFAMFAVWGLRRSRDLTDDQRRPNEAAPYRSCVVLAFVVGALAIALLSARPQACRCHSWNIRSGRTERWFG